MSSFLSLLYSKMYFCHNSESINLRRKKRKKKQEVLVKEGKSTPKRKEKKRKERREIFFFKKKGVEKRGRSTTRRPGRLKKHERQKPCCLQERYIRPGHFARFSMYEDKSPTKSMFH